MSLAALTGTRYGPVPAAIAPEKVADYVAATGDDPDRWSTVAPPSYAGALLFMAAPHFIHSPEVGEHTRVLVHSDQTFIWHGPLAIGSAIEVTAEVARVRERGGLNFVTFDVAVDSGDGERLLDSRSTFLMGSEAAAEPGPDEGEPAVDEGSRLVAFEPVEPVAGAELPAVEVAASRLDLVRYAAASGDFNPIHFDHEAARTAGLDGIVVHGLLMAAWLARLASSTSQSTAPLAEMKLRFRNALRPARAAAIGGTVRDVSETTAQLALWLRLGDTDLVTATATTNGR